MFRAQSITKISRKIQNKYTSANNIDTILYIFKVCIQSTCTQSVICHVVCYAQPQKATTSCSFYSHPVSSPCTTALLLGSFITVYHCWALKLTFYAISVCFWLQKPLKRKTLQNCAPSKKLCFPSYPLQLLPCYSNSGWSVFTCQRINPAICAIQAF